MSKSFDQVVRNFTLYRVVSRFSFYVPIYVVALIAAGFSFLTIGLILFVYGISTMAFGSWAEQSLERRGASKTIARGEAAKACSNLLIGAVLYFTFAVENPMAVAVLLIAQICGGAGYCYAAVGDGSYLAEAGKTSAINTQMQARGQAQSSSYMFMSFLVAGCIGALLFPLMPALPFLLTALANIAAFSISLFALNLSDANLQPKQSDTHASLNRTFTRLTISAKVHVLTYAFLRATVLAMQLLILPIWLFIGLKIEVVFFGMVFGLYTLAGFLGGRFYPYIEKKLSQPHALFLVQIITIASMLAIGLGDGQIIVLLAPIGLFAAAGMLRPAYLPRLTQATTTEGFFVNSVATAEKMFGAISSVAYFAGAALFQVGFNPSFIVLAATCLLIVLAFLSLNTMILKPIKPRSDSIH